MTDDEARALAIAATDGLIYEHGIRAVGMDDVRDASGISLKRLYRLFPSKDDLVALALRQREASFVDALAADLAKVADPHDRVLEVFAFLRRWFVEADFRGCPFVRALSADRMSPAGQVGADQKKDFRKLLRRLARQAGHPAAVGDQLFILTQGAILAATALDWPGAADRARDAAMAVLGPRRA
jgi:AcrR family transcriptional regulator